MLNDFGIYVHSPWCKTRCPYCAFNVFVDHDADYDAWVRSVRRAWAIEEPHFGTGAHSLYFGGGTPSLTPTAVIQQLIEALPLASEAEVTLETNPGTIQPDGLRAMVDAGVNRLSLGIQTFNETHAKRLGRGHTIEHAHQLVRLANALGFRTWSMDLMFALPDQTEDELIADLDRIIEVSPPHISLYGLTIEPNTPFDRAHRRGTISTPDSDVWRRMYDRIVSTLEASGWERYEVSNFARPGHRAVHNEAVWRGGHYAGLGPGAHGFRPSGERTVGPASLDQWFEAPAPTVSRPSPVEHAIDHILSTVRHMDGLNLTALHAQTGHSIDDGVMAVLINSGALYRYRDHLRLSPEAFPIADGIVERLIDGLITSESVRLPT